MRNVFREFDQEIFRTVSSLSRHEKTVVKASTWDELVVMATLPS